jgi:hypothetical protein
MADMKVCAQRSTVRSKMRCSELSQFAGRRHRSLENSIDRQTHFWKLRSIASLPRCHPASLVARLERRACRKKLRRKISTDDVQTAEEASMAVTYFPFIRTEDGTRQVKHRSAKAKPPRSGGPKECQAILPMRGGRIQACRRSERWRVFGRGCTEEVRRCAGRFE